MAEIGIWFSCAAMMGLFLWAIHEGINFFVVLIIFLTVSLLPRQEVTW